MLAKQLLDGWLAPGPHDFAWHFLRVRRTAAATHDARRGGADVRPALARICGQDSHEACFSTAERALEMLARFDEALANSWRKLLRQPLERGAVELSVELFTGTPEDEGTRLTDANKHDAILAGCRKRLLLERAPALRALQAGFVTAPRPSDPRPPATSGLQPQAACSHRRPPATGGLQSHVHVASSHLVCAPRCAQGAGEFTGLLLWSLPELRQLMHGTARFDTARLYASGRNLTFDAACAPRVRTALIALLVQGASHGWEHTHARRLLQFCTAFSVRHRAHTELTPEAPAR